MSIILHANTFKINYEIILWESHRCFSSECLLNIKTCLQDTNKQIKKKNNFKNIYTLISSDLKYFGQSDITSLVWAHPKLVQIFSHVKLFTGINLALLHFVELFSSLYLPWSHWWVTTSSLTLWMIFKAFVLSSSRADSSTSKRLHCR